MPKPFTAADIREAFLRYFEARGHRRVGRYGKARIARELSVLGFSKEVSAAALVDAAGAAEAKALSTAFEKLWRRSEGIDPAARRRRVAGALSRKGFAAEAISAMMQGSHEEDEMDLG